MMRDLANRNLLPEKMDDPGLSSAELQKALSALNKINRLSRSAQPFWQQIKSFCQSKSQSNCSVLDLGTGSGYIPFRLERLARDSGLQLDITGADLNPASILMAQQAAAMRSSSCKFIQLDGLDPSSDRKYDLVICSLFLHHFSADQSRTLLSNMQRLASGAVVVSDLRRSALGLMLAYLASRLVTNSPVVHYDAPQSVRAAYTIEEVRKLALSAGWPAPKIRGIWPNRYLLTTAL